MHYFCLTHFIYRLWSFDVFGVPPICSVIPDCKLEERWTGGNKPLLFDRQFETILFEGLKRLKWVKINEQHNRRLTQRSISVFVISTEVESSWNVMAHGDGREGNWRENWRMEWVASTLHNTSEHGVSSITTADAHISAASNLNGLVRFAERRNLVSARVPSHFNWPLPTCILRLTGTHGP
jgi:hypothetical protein